MARQSQGVHRAVAGRGLQYALTALAVAVSLSGGSVTGLSLPSRPESLKFAVLGDFGDGDQPEYDVAAQMARVRERFPFEFVITTGDNFLGSQEDPHHLAEKFERPFAPLLQAGVRFYASLGNHDKPSISQYPLFNMSGRQYYTFARKNVRFFVLDTNYYDRRQAAWLEEALRSSQDDWKICYFHHPLYSNGSSHGPEIELRILLEPLFARYGVDVVFSGHEHVYERLTPQKGIQYFVNGSGGQAIGKIEPGGSTVAAYADDQSFMMAEVIGHDLYFETVSRTGATVDGGVFRRPPRN
ncbi:MAG: metallophosphoesterase [Vicinamibacterales bacterium]